jgi:hypothetical protein
MATVVESPWTQLLGGIGQGLSEGVKIGMAKKQQEIDLTKEILAGTASGKYDPRIWASTAGRDFLKAAKIDKDPMVQQLVQSGLSLMPQPEPTKLPSGDLVNIPQPDYYELGMYEKAPSAKEVQDTIYAEDQTRKLAQAQKESDLIFQRQSAMDSLRWARMQKIDNPAMLIETVKQSLFDSGANLDDWNITANSKGQISVTYNKDATGRITPNKAIELSERFDNETETAFTRRTTHIKSLSGILAGDVSMANADIDPSDTVAMALKQAAEAISSAKGSSKRIMERASRVQDIIRAVNEEIDVKNRSIENAGKRAGRTSEQIERSKIREIKFEDVSGGLSVADWLKARAKEDTPAKDLISDMRSAPLENRSVAGGFSGSRAGNDADKLKRVHDGVKDVVLAAVASNPDLTSADIKSNILSMKREIMAEYGLNERLWSMLMTMADRIMG